MLANRLRKRHRHLRKWGRRLQHSAWRLYERDIPEHPLVVDWYDGHAVVWAFDRKRDETVDQEQAWLDTVITEVGEGLDLPAEHIHLKRRLRQRGLTQYERLAEESAIVHVQEHGRSFETNLSDYLDTGLFMDHRDTRQLVADACDGKRCLNLFAYTGAFSIAMLAGGAELVTTVDLSATYLDWCRRNVRLNELPVRKHQVVQADCLAWLEQAPTETYDLIVCDPPTFSNSKRMQKTWSVARDHGWLLWRLWNFTAPGGTVYFSTNDRGFDLADSGLPPYSVQELTPDSIPEDFRNRRIHRCWKLDRA